MDTIWLKLTLNESGQCYEDLKKILNIVFISLSLNEKPNKKSFTDFFANISLYPLKWTKRKRDSAGFLLRFYFKISGRQLKAGLIQRWIYDCERGDNADGE